MSNFILFMAREFTVGGAAYLALRHLRHIAASQTIDFLVSGAVCPTMAAALPPTVALEQLDLRTEVVEQGLWATREALASTGHPFLEREYAAVLGTSLFPDLAACAAFSMSRSRRKVLILLDEGPLHAPRSSEQRAAIRGAMLSADHIVSVSRALLDKLGAEYPLLHDLPATILPPPIDAVATVEPPAPFAITSTTMASDSHLPHVVTVARLSAEKCVNTCLQVHRSVRDVGLDFHWHVVGEGQERRNLEREIARRRMSDRFHLEGFQPDVSPWMRHADLFVLLSSAEGCPTVIREALAAGTPVLCTDVSGARELIDEGVTGIVVSHHFPEISAALKRLLQNPAERARLRQNITSRKSTPQSCSVRHESERLLELLSGDPRSRPPAVVTILIPTYNHERSIGSAIQSALMQDYPALEVVVCDDASTDATDVAARRWSHDPRLRIRRHATNQGRVANYRLGLEREATGTWVLMLDGDDHLVDPTFIT
ncbi:MAG: glycosyltransferase [Planctomycetota bacterium]